MSPFGAVSCQGELKHLDGTWMMQAREREILYAIVLLRQTFPIPFFFLQTPAFKTEDISLSAPITIQVKLCEN